MKTLFLLILYIHVVFGQFESEEDEENLNDNQKMNVVLFLAQSNSNSSYANDDGLKILNLVKEAIIEPCTSKLDLPRLIKKLVDDKLNTCNCDEILKTSLMSLINYSRNAKRMATAIASSTNETLPDTELLPVSLDTNKNMNYYHYKVDSKNSIPERHEIIKELQPPAAEPARNYEEIFAQLPLKQDKNIVVDDLPNLQPVDMSDNFQMFHVVPPSPKIKWPRKYWMKSKRHLLARPEEKQVFEINSKVKPEAPREILDIPALKHAEKPKTFMELLGVMASIRNSFFNNFLYPELDPKRKVVDEESGLNIKRIGQTCEPTFFELVKRTFRSAKSEGENGFLMTVIGANLSDISDPYSNLVQSIKYIDENTNDEDTLLVVTGACPKETLSLQSEAKKTLLPVYAKGPNSEILAEAQNLFDVPRLIKKALYKKSNKEHSSERTKEDFNFFRTPDEKTKVKQKMSFLNEKENRDFDRFEKIPDQHIQEFIYKRNTRSGALKFSLHKCLPITAVMLFKLNKF